MIGVGTFKVTDKMRDYVNESLDNERISYGPMSRKLEAQFAKMHDCKFAVLSNSGTSSLQVALQTLKELHGWKDGDEVLVPSVTFVATVNIILHNNMTPILVDVEHDMYGMEPVLVERAVTDRTRAMIPVHLFGMPCNMSALSSIAKAHDLKVLGDSCETMLVRHRGVSCGAWGDIVCFSMYVAHLLTAGVGGIATTNNPDYAAVMRSLVNHGRDGIYISIDDDEGLTNSQLKEVISRRFNFERIGHSYRITELEAALALAQLDDLHKMIETRQQNAGRLTAALWDLNDVLQLPTIRPRTDSSFMMMPLVLKHETKENLVAFLEEHGVETRDMLPLTNQPCYKGMWNPDDYPVATWINESGFYCGVHHALTYNDIDLISDLIHDYFQRTA